MPLPDGSTNEVESPPVTVNVALPSTAGSVPNSGDVMSTSSTVAPAPLSDDSGPTDLADAMSTTPDKTPTSPLNEPTSSTVVMPNPNSESDDMTEAMDAFPSALQTSDTTEAPSVSSNSSSNSTANSTEVSKNITIDYSSASTQNFTTMCSGSNPSATAQSDANEVSDQDTEVGQSTSGTPTKKSDTKSEPDTATQKSPSSPQRSNPPPDPRKVILTLGNYAALGSDYNAITGEIRKTSSVEIEEVIKEDITKRSGKCCKLEDVWDFFDLSQDQMLDIHLDRAALHGSAKILKEQLDPFKEQVVLIHTEVSTKNSLKDSQLQQIEDVSKGTHVISALEYGAKVIFLFETNGAEINRKVGMTSLSDVIEKIPHLKTLRHRGRELLNYFEKELCKKVRCKIFTDLPMIQEATASFQQALKVYHEEIPSHPRADSHIPLRAWLSEVHLETHVPDDLLSRASVVISTLSTFISQAEILLQTEPMKRLATFRRKIQFFIEVVSKYKVCCQEDLTTKLELVKSGAFGPELVEKTILGMETGPFHTAILLSWIKSQVDLVNNLNKVTQRKYMGRIKLARTGEIDQINKSNWKYVTLFRLVNTSEEYQYLWSMMQYLVEAGVSSNTAIDMDELKTLAIHSGSPSTLNETLEDVLSMADQSRLIHSTMFILTDDPPGEDEGKGQMSVYGRGALIFDNFVPKLPKPECTEVSHDSIEVRWSGKGFPWVVHYQVAYKQSYETKWTPKQVDADENQLLISGLRSGTMYDFKVRFVTQFGITKYSPELKYIPTAPCRPPPKPEALQISNKRCAVKWSVPKTPLQYRNSKMRAEAMRWEVEISWDGGAKFKFKELSFEKYMPQVEFEEDNVYIDLEEDKTYTFRVRLCANISNPETRTTADVKTLFSPESDPISLQYLTDSEMIKNCAVVGSKLQRRSSPRIYDLNLRCEYEDRANRLRKLSYGNPNSIAPMKTILVVGATGAGKSTLVNAFINYVMDVKWEDDYRFRLIQERLSANQAKSQTKWITAYVLYHQKSFLVPYSLTIIDTPGFGDTAGIQADQQITEQLSAYFHVRGHEGIDSLDAIGFVVQASSARLTPTQRYIFDSILALFGKDIAENIFMLITFADGQKPPVLQGLKEAQLPYTQAFKFNNSAIFAERQSDCKGDDENWSDSENEEESFDKMFWNMGAVSYRKFLSHLAKTNSKSLTLTNEVLDQRQHLEVHVTGIHEQIREGLGKLEELKAGLRCLRDHQADIDRNKDFEYTVNVQKTIKIDLKRGTYVTNCLTCNRTCHYPCGIPRDEDKAGCWAMDRRNNDSYCRICPTGCHWSVHVNTPYRYEIQDTTEIKTASDLKAQYESACQEKLTTEQVIVKMVEDIDAREIYTASLTDEVRKSLAILNEIALKPSHLTTVEYIDILIQSERNQALPGWQLRTRQLEAVRERAVTLSQVAQRRGVTEPWEQLRKAIEEEHEREKESFLQSLADNIKKFLFRRM